MYLLALKKMYMVLGLTQRLRLYGNVTSVTLRGGSNVYPQSMF